MPIQHFGTFASAATLMFDDCIIPKHPGHVCNVFHVQYVSMCVSECVCVCVKKPV